MKKHEQLELLYLPHPTLTPQGAPSLEENLITLKMYTCYIFMWALSPYYYA